MNEKFAEPNCIFLYTFLGTLISIEEMK